MNMKWEDMSNKERAEQTIRDIKLRQERRRIGKQEADCYMFNQVHKAKKAREKIRSKQYRGSW